MRLSTSLWSQLWCVKCWFYLGETSNSPQWEDKNMLGNIDNLFLKCMQKVTKVYLYHLLGVLDYYVMYRQRACQFCEMSAMVTN